MTFVTISPKQAAQYSYMCIRLKQMTNKMSTARKTLEEFANKSFDKTFAKCVYLLASEALQCENEILSHIDSLNCNNYEIERFENKRSPLINTINGLESLCTYFEEVYLNSYKKILKDKHFADSIKNLMQNHLQLFMTGLTQLRLLIDLKISVN